MHRRRFLGAALGVLALGACAGVEPEREGESVRGTGTVRRYEIEGGFWAIRGDAGTTYDPVDLGEAFREDGLRVRFRARILPSRVGFHMVGPIVELVEISRL